MNSRKKEEKRKKKRKKDRMGEQIKGNQKTTK